MHNIVELDNALKLANLTKKQVSAEYIQEIVKDMGYSETVADDERGYALTLYCGPAEKQGHWPKVIVLTETAQLNRFIDQVSEDTGKPIKDSYVFPDNPNYVDELWALLEPIRTELRSWFEDFANNNGVSFERLKTLCDDVQPKIIAAHATDDPWQPNMGMTFGKSSSLRSFVLAKHIIWPIFRHEGEMFRRIDKCSECDNFFFAERMGRETCSNACRNRKFQRLRKEADNG